MLQGMLLPHSSHHCTSLGHRTPLLLWCRVWPNSWNMGLAQVCLEMQVWIRSVLISNSRNGRMKLWDKAQLRVPVLQPWLPFVMLRKSWLMSLLQNQCLVKCFGKQLQLSHYMQLNPLPLHCGNTLLERINCYNLISPVEVIWLH